MSLDGLLNTLGCTHAQLIQLADDHTLTVQGWLASRAPQAARFKGHGIQASSTGLKVQLLNLALGGEFPRNTAINTITQEVQEVCDFFEKRAVPWGWWISPRHHILGPYIEEYAKLTSNPPGLPVMVAALPAPTPRFDKNIRVWQAKSRADLSAASMIRRLAFRFPQGEALSYFEDMADDWLSGTPARLYLAGMTTQSPGAIGALIMGANLPGVYVMATLPDMERHGLAKAILHRIVQVAAEEGQQMLVLTASAKGFNLYRKFGFERVFEYQIYQKH
jgi:GNAT superfamily N-acetyltransferase